MGIHLLVDPALTAMATTNATELTSKTQRMAVRICSPASGHRIIRYYAELHRRYCPLPTGSTQTEACSALDTECQR